MIICTYTDNIMDESLDEEKVSKTKQKLENCFGVKMMLEVDYTLGIKLERTKKEVRIFQKVYVKRILEKFNMANCKPRSILLLVRIFLLTNNSLTDKKKVAKMKKISYYETLELLI